MTKKILLLGSGELGKEFVIAAQRKGQYVIACDSYEGAPAMQVADEYEVFSMLDGDALEAVGSDGAALLLQRLDISTGIQAHAAGEVHVVHGVCHRKGGDGYRLILLKYQTILPHQVPQLFCC